MEARSIQISERIRQLRTLKGFSQEFMSDTLGVSLRQYQRLEHGQREWSLSQLILLSKNMGVSLAYLIDTDVPLFQPVKKGNLIVEINTFFDAMANRIEELKERCCDVNEHEQKSLPDA